MNIIINHTAYIFPEHTHLRDILQTAMPGQRFLGAINKGQVIELSDPLSEDCTLTPLTLQHEEGRRIMERTLRHIMLQAVRKLYGNQTARIQYSMCKGCLVTLPGMTLSGSEIDTIAAVMHEIVAADEPFVRQMWSMDQIRSYYLQIGAVDKVKLLSNLPDTEQVIYGCGNVWDNFHGAMLPSTGCVGAFDLIPTEGGFILMPPSPADPTHPTAFVDSPKMKETFAESGRWCNILGIRNLTDLQDMNRLGNMRSFIRVNEQLHNRSLSAIANQIAEGKKQIILIAGPSSSGKTTSACRLCVQLRVLGYHPVQVSMDNYYLNRCDIKPGPDGSPDFQSIEALDIVYLQQQINQLLNGESVQIPTFNFNTGLRQMNGAPVTLGPGEPLVIEGIHGLNPDLTADLPQDKIFRIFVSALTYVNIDDHNRIRTTDVRLLRRITRDFAFRGTSSLHTIRMWSSVRAGQQKWIFPYQQNADALFNTTLHYELPFLKQKVYDLLQTIPSDDPDYRWADRLINILKYVPDADPEITDEIPPTSILREFIGGSTFDKG